MGVGEERVTMMITVMTRATAAITGSRYWGRRSEKRVCSVTGRTTGAGRSSEAGSTGGASICEDAGLTSGAAARLSSSALKSGRTNSIQRGQ